jgi:nucleoid DNA-binding protein
MVKQDFVNIVMTSAGCTRKKAENAVDALLDAMARALEEHGEVRLTGIGKMYSILRKPFTVTNRLTGNEERQIPATRTVKFNVSGRIKERLNR